jgi:hypothetical protein
MTNLSCPRCELPINPFRTPVEGHCNLTEPCEIKPVVVATTQKISYDQFIKSINEVTTKNMQEKIVSMQGNFKKCIQCKTDQNDDKVITEKGLMCFYCYAKSKVVKSSKGAPVSGKMYALTGAPGAKCISNGNTWADSEVK